MTALRGHGRVRARRLMAENNAEVAALTRPSLVIPRAAKGPHLRGTASGRQSAAAGVLRTVGAQRPVVAEALRRFCKPLRGPPGMTPKCAFRMSAGPHQRNWQRDWAGPVLELYPDSLISPAPPSTWVVTDAEHLKQGPSAIGAACPRDDGGVYREFADFDGYRRCSISCTRWWHTGYIQRNSLGSMERCIDGIARDGKENRRTSHVIYRLRTDGQGPILKQVRVRAGAAR